jgi:hypothetical protein
LAQGGDVLVRAAWTRARWQEEDGKAFDIIRTLANCEAGVVNRPIWLRRNGGAPLKMRLVAIRMPKALAVKAVSEARAEASPRDGDSIRPLGAYVSANGV